MAMLAYVQSGAFFNLAAVLPPPPTAAAANLPHRAPMPVYVCEAAPAGDRTRYSCPACHRLLNAERLLLLRFLISNMLASLDASDTHLADLCPLLSHPELPLPNITFGPNPATQDDPDPGSPHQ